MRLPNEADEPMICPVCGAEGADDQPVGPTVTVFCCPTCVTTVLRSFARRAVEPVTATPLPPSRADAARPSWRPATA